MKTVQKTAMIVSKVCECTYWIAEAVFTVLFLASLAARGWMKELIMQIFEKAGSGIESAEFKLLGFELNLSVNGEISMTAFSLLCFSAILLAFLSAMVFRNLYLILRTTLGKTSFSKGQTPFQKDNVRMIREIGIFYIAESLLGLIMGIICRLILGSESTGLSIGLNNILAGIVFICLSKTFAYGTKLQDDVEGLV